MTKGQQYLAALAVAMRFHFNLNGNDPETVHAVLMQAEDTYKFASDVLEDAGLPDVLAWDPFGNFTVDRILDSIELLVRDICASVSNTSEYKEAA